MPEQSSAPDANTPFLHGWLLFIYRVPQDPPGRRTYVWRQLRQCGAAYLQQAAAILPDTPEMRETLSALALRVREFDGEASLLETSSPDPGWEAETIARFDQHRAEEYAELIENIERFEDEIARESRRGKFTFAELEDLEADWEKLTRWRERIRARDFFDSSSRSDTDVALERAQGALSRFIANVEDEAEPRSTSGT